MDDPTWCCDYKSRCDNKIIKRFLESIQKYLDDDIPKTNYNNDIEYWIAEKEKWKVEYEQNEEDDK